MAGAAMPSELVGLAGGPGRVLLVGQGPPGARDRLQAFAKELFEEEEEKGGGGGGGERRGCKGRELHVRLGCSSGSRLPLPGAGLVVVLVGAPWLLQEPRGGKKQRRRRLLLLREMLLDLRLRLDPLPALVAVAVLQPHEEPQEEEEEEVRRQLEALLRRTLGPGTRTAPEALQAALHTPGAGAQEVREAACRALRAAALQRRSNAAADEVETKKQKLPLFFKCLPWGRRRQQRKGHLGTDANKFNEDTPQDQDEGLALT